MNKMRYLIAVLLAGACLSAHAAAPVTGDFPTDSLPSAGDLRGERGIVDANNIFVPRGQWIFGGGASYSTHRNDHYDFVVIEDIQSDGYTFKVNPMVAYAVRDNMAVGARFIYSRSLLKVDGAELSLGDEASGMNLSAEEYYKLRHSYLAAAVWRQYIPLGKDKRLALFNEVTLAAGGHQTKFASGVPVKGTYESGFEASLGVSPGLVAFVNNMMAVELNVGVLGLNYDQSRQIRNQVSTADIRTSYMNFNINLLAINLGVVFYL